MFFDVNMLAEHLEHIATERGGTLAGFISTLGLRIRGMLADRRLGAVIARDPPASFDAWLRDYVGDDRANNGQIAIVDLSLVPSEIDHIVVSVLTRLIFESLQRYRHTSSQGQSLPTVLVLEEAHHFVRRGKDDEDAASSPAQLCREVFERIAREGRKFGLGLVLSSQRPSELSPTVLAQCNTFYCIVLLMTMTRTLSRGSFPTMLAACSESCPACRRDKLSCSAGPLQFQCSWKSTNYRKINGHGRPTQISGMCGRWPKTGQWTGVRSPSIGPAIRQGERLASHDLPDLARRAAPPPSHCQG